jgi:hypothetical protein
MAENVKNIKATIRLGRDKYGEIVLTLNDVIYEGEYNRNSRPIDLEDLNIPRKLDINNRGQVFVEGGFFGNTQYYLQFDDNKNYFYTGQSSVFTNTINVKFTIDYERGSETLKIGEDDDMIKALSFILDKKSEERDLKLKAANDNNPESLRKAA